MILYRYRWLAALAALLALLVLMLTNSNGSANAEKWPVPIPAQPVAASCCGSIVGHYASEHMEAWNANADAEGILEIPDYFISDIRSDGTRVLYFNGGDYDTVNYVSGGRFNADYLRIAYEKTPGNYVTIKSYGSTSGPQNTVSVTWHIPTQDPVVITDPSATPAWRFTLCGFIGNDPYCDVDYGAI